MRLLRYLLISGSASVAAGSLVLAGQVAVTTAAAGRGRHLTSSQPSAHFVARARAALISYLDSGKSAPVSSIEPDPVNDPAAVPPVASSAVGSYNWSGYADSGTSGTFTKVSGVWRTPRLSCTREDGLSSAWVGLDGYSNDTVEQDGTFDWCYEGHAFYFTWWEMYPNSAAEVGNAVRPGDKIKAEVTRSGADYTLSVTDATHKANSFSQTATCDACANSSAEWILERPGFATTGTAPLADYHSWKLSSATETANGKSGTISSYPSHKQIDMVDATRTYLLNTTSGLMGGGAMFVTHWLNSY